MISWLCFAGGLAMVSLGAELFVRGSAALARAWGISPLVIGLTLVAMGTSAPELAVSLQGVFDGRFDIAVGNVVGSNISNVFFILGVSALILPLVVHAQILRWDAPVMVAASGLLWLAMNDGALSRTEGLLFVLLLIGYTGAIIFFARREKNTTDYEGEYFSTAKTNGFYFYLFKTGVIFSGLALLIVGARGMVSGAVEIARGWDISEAVIGLTVVAVGTSLPELATSVAAAFKGERDIVVGNLVGSSIFNILGVAGFCGVLAPGGLQIASGIVQFDLPVMVASAVACLPVFFTGSRIGRREGCVFLFYYLAYVAYLILKSSEHASLPFFSLTMFVFVIPVTVITVFILAAQEFRRVSRGVSSK